MSKKSSQENIVTRPPIIVVMGHIDHGKSQLLDYIRKSKVVEGEAGGITQHMYAYEIEHPVADGEDKKITFLDTPGHEAFTLMRERGADVADIAILVVAGDDGVKQQTKEAIKIIKESKIPFIVAINKKDLPNFSADKVKQQLAEEEIFLEGYGGHVSNVELSAKTGDGIPELLELIVLLADIEDFKGNTNTPAEGVVIEAHRDPKKGVSATLLIHNGTLEKGSFVVCGNTFAPVRRIDNFLEKPLDTATFSSPVRISGFNEIPAVGSSFSTVPSKKEAEKCIKENAEKSTKEEKGEDHVAEAATAETVTVPLIVKADMEGTLEAVLYEIGKIKVEGVVPQIIQSGVGAISEGDIKRAGSTTSPIVVGFNVEPEKNATALAHQLEIGIETFSIIYSLTEWLLEELTKRKPRISVEESLGKAKIIRVFSKTKDKQVVGGKVREGKLEVGSQVKILRRDIEIARGKIVELQQQKVKTSEVAEGEEFGALIESREHDIAEGDYVESFVVTDK